MYPFKKQIRIVKIFVFLGIVAVVLSLIGLFALISLNIVGRTKEVGIRKILGASGVNIMQVINRDYVIILGVGTIIGILISYTLVPLFMQSVWAYHVRANGWAILLATAILITTCLFMVGMKIVNTSAVNPIELLRDE